MDITFEENAAEHVAASFGATVEDGYLFDQETGERITNPDGEHIHIDDLAIIEDGSTIFVDDNFDSLVKHVERQRS